jgi:hypothetical protein
LSFLTGAANLGAGLGALKNIAAELFPDQVSIKFKLNGETDKEIFLDSVQVRRVETTAGVSEFPAENQKVFQQNISTNPRVITFSAYLSSIPRLNNLKTGSNALKYATSLLIPEVASLTNILLNEDDSVAERLADLRSAMGYGDILQILGLPDNDTINFILTSVVDIEDLDTGSKGKKVELSVREAQIVGLDAPQPPSKGLFSKITSTISGGLNKAGKAVTKLVGV